MLSEKYYFIYHNTSTIILLALYTLIAGQWKLFTCLSLQKRQNLKLKLVNTLCLSFNTISPVQFIYHELRYTYVKAMEVTHHSDIHFHLSYSALLKCQDNFRFKIKSNNTFAL